MALSALGYYRRSNKARAKPLSLNMFILKWADSKQPLDQAEVAKIRCPSCNNLMMNAMQTECGHRMCLQCLGPDAETRLVRLQLTSVMDH